MCVPHNKKTLSRKYSIPCYLNNYCFFSFSMSTTTVLVSNPWSSTTSLASDVKDDGLSELSDFVSKVARLELREDKHTREECLKQLREWISKNPDLENCITGSRFFKMFIRVLFLVLSKL